MNAASVLSDQHETEATAEIALTIFIADHIIHGSIKGEVQIQHQYDTINV